MGRSATVLVALLSLATASTIAAEGPEVLEPSQREFLDGLMRDTWNFIDYACDPVTGIPQDYQARGGHTNSTPVGLYIASLAVANRLGIITEDEATVRLAKVLTSMERLHQDHGFFPNFFPVNLSSIPTDGVMIISDYNFYPAGLIVARQVWPQYAERINAYLDSIEWDRLYVEETNQIVAGYDLATEEASIVGLWLASDARCAVTMMIGAGVVPPNVWEDMIRGPIEAGTGPIYQPGFSFGVTYIAAITGLFLPERDTEVGQTVANLGWYQYQFSRRRGYPVWGWSNCNIPGRHYTAGGYIPEWTVTPHALALLIDYYPRHVTAALQKMQALGGDSPPPGHPDVEWGLRGCYDVEMDVWGEKFLQLEQGMMFLALANFLHDGIVRDIFTSDSLIARGLELSEPYIQHDPDLLRRWEERDATPLEKGPAPDTGPVEAQVTDILETGELYSHQPESLRITRQDGAAVVTITGDEAWTELAFGIAIPTTDIEHLDQIEFDIEVVQSDNPEPGFLRVFLADKFGQTRFAWLELDPQKRKHALPAREIWGFFLDDDNLASMMVQFHREPWFYPWHKFRSQSATLNFHSIKVRAGG